MDIEKYKKIVANPNKSQDELERMGKNALSKGKSNHAEIAFNELNRRFPNWNKPWRGEGNSRPTVASFCGEEYEFLSEKKAYIWLVNKFIGAYPMLFTNINWETKFVAMGLKRLYFSRTPEKLFFGTPKLAENPNNYVKLSNGWLANVNLDKDKKLDVLINFAAVAKLEYGTEWKWEVLA